MKESAIGDHKKLLLIDDDPNLILLVKDYLEFRGYEVVGLIVSSPKLATVVRLLEF